MVEGGKGVSLKRHGHRLRLRGSYMTGFTYACRRPKPLDFLKRRLPGLDMAEADVAAEL